MKSGVKTPHSKRTAGSLILPEASGILLRMVINCLECLMLFGFLVYPANMTSRTRHLH